ncbi:MAG TPA: hypothetical protein DCZ94_22290 [Lentisphaeria bacterium]|nr:MAG: hypothetical protein A2X48_13530 [Lentisphaerae bacterium GWF2_49_21]HBC89678.1 hypothetical protein [Lentisphaeria bacterium]
MDLFNPFIEDFFRLVRGHLMEIMLVFVGTVLSVYGGDINKALMKKIKKENFFVRFGTFVALCAVGYGFIALIIGKVLVKYMGQLSNIWLLCVIAGLFILIGLIAEEKNHI